MRECWGSCTAAVERATAPAAGTPVGRAGRDWLRSCRQRYLIPSEHRSRVTGEMRNLKRRQHKHGKTTGLICFLFFLWLFDRLSKLSVISDLSWCCSVNVASAKIVKNCSISWPNCFSALVAVQIQSNPGDTNSKSHRCLDQSVAPTAEVGVNTTPHTSIFHSDTCTRIAQVWVRTHPISCFMCHLVCLSDCSLFDHSTFLSFLTIFSLITLSFLLPVNFIFQDVVDKFPVHFRQ